jgi:hypothetical protein
MSNGKIVPSRKISIRSVTFRKTAPTTEESDKEKDSFYWVICHFSKYKTIIQFENFNAKLRWEIIFKSIESENSNANRNDKCGTIVNLSQQKSNCQK